MELRRSISSLELNRKLAESRFFIVDSGGCAAGFLIGLQRGSLPAAFGGCAVGQVLSFLSNDSG